MSKPAPTCSSTNASISASARAPNPNNSVSDPTSRDISWLLPTGVLAPTSATRNSGIVANQATGSTYASPFATLSGPGRPFPSPPHFPAREAGNAPEASSSATSTSSFTQPSVPNATLSFFDVRLSRTESSSSLPLTGGGLAVPQGLMPGSLFTRFTPGRGTDEEDIIQSLSDENKSFEELRWEDHLFAYAEGQPLSTVLQQAFPPGFQQSRLSSARTRSWLDTPMSSVPSPFPAPVFLGPPWLETPTASTPSSSAPLVPPHNPFGSFPSSGTPSSFPTAFPAHLISSTTASLPSYNSPSWLASASSIQPSLPSDMPATAAAATPVSHDIEISNMNASSAVNTHTENTLTEPPTAMVQVTQVPSAVKVQLTSERVAELGSLMSRFASVLGALTLAEKIESERGKVEEKRKAEGRLQRTAENAERSASAVLSHFPAIPTEKEAIREFLIQREGQRARAISDLNATITAYRQSSPVFLQLDALTKAEVQSVLAHPQLSGSFDVDREGPLCDSVREYVGSSTVQRAISLFAQLESLLPTLTQALDEATVQANGLCEMLRHETAKLLQKDEEQKESAKFAGEDAALVAQQIDHYQAMLRRVEEESEEEEEYSSLERNLVERQKLIKAAKRKYIQAKRELEDREMEGESITEQMKARVVQLEEDAARVEREAESILAQLHGMAESGSVMGKVAQLHLHASNRESKEDPQWLNLLSSGVALQSRRKDDYKDLAPLSQSVSQVLIGTLRGTAERCVLKLYMRGKDEKLFYNEVNLLTRLEHPNVIALQCVFRDHTHFYLQFPYVEGGNLRQWLDSSPRNPEEKRTMFRGLVQGLCYLHSLKIVHRDLKPENVLVGTDARPRLADFGISRSDNSLLSITLASSSEGTPSYKSPEQLRNERASPAADIYALGLILYEILFGKPYPLTLEQRAINSLSSPSSSTLLQSALPDSKENVEQQTALPSRLAEHAVYLLSRLLQADPGHRPTAFAVLADPFCETAVSNGTSFGTSNPSNSAGNVCVSQLISLLNAGMYDGSIQLAHVQLEAENLPDVLSHAAMGQAVDVVLAIETVDPATNTLAVVTEAALNDFFVHTLTESSGMFVAAEHMDDRMCVLPAPDMLLNAAKESLYVAFGRALAQCVIQRIPVDIATRFPPAFYRVLLEGTTAKDASLLELLQDLGTFDRTLAKQYRNALLAQNVREWEIEGPNLLGLTESINEVNRADVIRRQCVQHLIGTRIKTYEAIRRGFYSLPLVKKMVSSSALTAEQLQEVLYAKEERTRADFAVESAASRDWIRENTKQCPRCQVPIERNRGCLHMTCRQCGHEFWWCCMRAFSTRVHHDFFECEPRRRSRPQN